MAYETNQTGKCPHCAVQVRFEAVNVHYSGHNRGEIPPFILMSKGAGRLHLVTVGCPACFRIVLFAKDTMTPGGAAEPIESLFWPDCGNRTVPIEVESASTELASDFREAAAVFSKSKKASAALSRRCLQFILREKAKTKSDNLSRQIEEVLDTLPSELAANVDAIRQIGNFAAHPIKAESSGEIVAVEEGEAEWLLDVLEELFDYYYVAPKKAAERRLVLNAKLESMGKPPLKSPNRISSDQQDA